MQPRCSRDAVEMQPRYSRDTAEIQSRYSRDTAEIQRRCDSSATRCALPAAYHQCAAPKVSEGTGTQSPRGEPVAAAADANAAASNATAGAAADANADSGLAADAITNTTAAASVSASAAETRSRLLDLAQSLDVHVARIAHDAATCTDAAADSRLADSGPAKRNNNNNADTDSGPVRLLRSACGALREVSPASHRLLSVHPK